MRIKTKHIVVIAVSSMIVAVVLVATLAGYSLYIEWKEDSTALGYNNAIFRLTVEMFKNEVYLHNVKVVPGGDAAHPGVPLIIGSIKNNSPKMVTSIMLEVSFSKPDGTVVYRDWFYPFGEGRFVHAGMEYTKNVLLPGEGISFRHLLRNCPSEVVEALSSQYDFAKSASAGDIKMECSIEGMSVL